MALEERLELDIAEALRGVDNIEDALTAATQAFKVGIAEALDLLSSVAIAEVDASVITTSIDAAVEAADLEPEITAETDGITAAIDEAVGAADLEAAVAADASQVTSAIDAAVEAADTQAVVDADASGIPESITAALGEVDASVEIGAITSGITEQIEAAITSADTELNVSANTDEAEASLQSLAEAGGAAEEGIGGSADAMGALGGASQLATGDLAGVGATLGAVSARGSAVAGGVLAVASALGAAASAALESETAQRRYNTVLGQFGDAVDSGAAITGFANNLGELAEKTGNSDEAMKLAAARIFDLGQSAGVAGPQVAATTDQILLLATRASVLNPTLGDAGAVADRLTVALARGGRALVDFGISLSPEQIEAFATSLGKSSDELTVYDRAAAGAALATQQLGERLRTDITEGADQPAIAIRRLQEEFGNALEAFGQPLLEPLIAALEAGQPALIELSNIFRDLGTVVIPLLIPVLQGLAGTLETVSAFVDVLTAPLQAAANWIGDLGDEAEDAAPAVVDLTGATRLFASQALGMESGLQAIVGGLEQVTEESRKAAEAEIEAVDARISTVGAIRSAEDAHRDFGDTLDEVTRGGQERFREGLEAEVAAAKAAEAALNGLLDAQLGFIDSSIGAEDAQRRFIEALDQTAQQAALVANPGTDPADQKRAQEAQAGFADSVREVRDAALAAAKADLRLAEDRAKASGATLSATDRQKAFAAALERAAAQASGPARDAILGLLNTYNDLPKDIETTAKADTAQAQSAQREYAESIRDVTDKAIRAAEEDLNLADMRAANAGRLLTPIERENIWRGSLEATASLLDGPYRASVLRTITLYDGIPKERNTILGADTKPASEKILALAALVKADILSVATKPIDANIEPAKAKIAALAELLKTDFANFLVRVDALNPPSAPRRPGAMAGGTFGPGELLVGEGGREIVVVQPGTSATVIPNAQTEALLAGRGRAALDPELTAAIRTLAAQPRFAVELGVIAAPGADPYPAAMETARQLQALSVRMSAQT